MGAKKRFEVRSNGRVWAGQAPKQKTTEGGIGKACKLVLALGMVLPLFFQPFVTKTVCAAEEDGSLITRTNEDGSMTVTQSYLETEEPPVVPEAINQEGVRYILDEQETRQSSEYSPPTKSFREARFSQVPLEGINNLPAYFPSTVFIDEGEYQGEIGLDPLEPFTTVAIYEAFSQQVDRVHVYTDLPDNDVTRIPAVRDFQVSSAYAPGATQIKTLKLLDVSYAIAGNDYLGLPNNYTATVTYRGEEEYLELAFYEVTANYSGEIASSVQELTMQATFVPEEAPVIISEGEVPLAAPEPSLFPLVIAGSTIAVFLALPLLYLFLLKNCSLLRVNERKSQNESEFFSSRKKEELELLFRKHLVVRNGIAEFRIPDEINLLSEDCYVIKLGFLLANRKGALRLVWQGRIMLVIPFTRLTEVDFRAGMAASVLAVLPELEPAH